MPVGYRITYIDAKVNSKVKYRGKLYNFTVMLRLTDKQFAAVYDGLLDETKKVIDNRYPYGEGGWIHYRVTDREQLEDAKLLLRVKLGCLAPGVQKCGRK